MNSLTDDLLAKAKVDLFWANLLVGKQIQHKNNHHERHLPEGHSSTCPSFNCRVRIAHGAAQVPATGVKCFVEGKVT